MKPRTRHLPLVLALAALLLAVAPAASAADERKTRPTVAKKKAAAKKRKALRADSILVNGGFDGGVSGWSAVNATLSGTAGVARVTATQNAQFSIVPAKAPVSSTLAGATYTAAGWVRSATPGRELCLRVREWSGSTVAGSAASCVTGTTAWKQFPAVAYKALAAGRTLDVYVYQRTVGRDSFEVDSLSLTVSAAAAPAPPAATCTKLASPAGNDAAAGTAAAPYRTAQKLVDSLSPGDTGCLAAGLFAQDVKVSRGGTQGNPVTIRSAPGERATLRGRLWIADSANDVVVTQLDLDGSNAGKLPSPSVMGDRIVFRGNDVTNKHTAICFLVGSFQGWGIARDVVIDANRIHNCGVLPAANHDHGIYVASSRNLRIVNNAIYDNADRGIQLYPDAQGTLIERNVIDGNGQGIAFGGGELPGLASSGNRAVNNVISNSKLRWNVESWWQPGNPVGTGNLAESNCVWNGARGNVGEQVGFVARNNVTADPLFVDRAGKDFRLRAGSPCAGKSPA